MVRVWLGGGYAIVWADSNASVVKPFRLKYNGPFSIDCMERGSHARGVYPIQDTSRMGTAKIKQEEQADIRIIARE